MRRLIITLQLLIYYLSRHWYKLAAVVIVLVWSLGWLAPVLMAVGQTEAGLTIHRWLRPHDHQLPQRAYFLFGEGGMVQTYSQSEVIALGAEPGNLRAFVGNARVGYKTAMNQRMLAIFTAMVLGVLMWPRVKTHLRVIPLTLLLLPMFADAFSHVASENGSGFREANQWAATLTLNALPPEFYSGTTFGTLNWLLRTATGFLFGLGLVWLLLLFLNHQFSDIERQLARRYGSASQRQGNTAGGST